MASHVYWYEGSPTVFDALCTDAATLFGFVPGGANFSLDYYDVFTIDDARALIGRAALKQADGRMLFVLGARSIPSEAQQALLKLFEEPPQGVMFVVLVPHGVLMPTLRSRGIAYPAVVGQANDWDLRARKFLAAASDVRSKEVASIIKNDDRARADSLELVSALERHLHTLFLGAPVPLWAGALVDLALVRTYLGDRSSSLKMLLEHLVVALPRAENS